MKLLFLLALIIGSSARANSLEGNYPLEGYPVERKVQAMINAQTLNTSRTMSHGCGQPVPRHPCDPVPPQTRVVLKWVPEGAVFPVSQFEGAANFRFEAETLIEDAAKNGGVLEGTLKIVLEEQNLTYAPSPSLVLCSRNIYQNIQLEFPKYGLSLAGRIFSSYVGGYSLALPDEKGACEKPKN